MFIKNLDIKNFRNIENIIIRPKSEINIIFGENAQGKTNILEAIWLFTGAKSFRGSKDSELLKKSEKICENNIIFNSLGIENEAKIILNEKRTAFFNNKKLSSPSLLAGNFGAVIFSPTDLSLIKQGPNQRRRFLDVSIGQLYPNFIEILKGYSKAVMQRNKIIKDYRYDKTLSLMLDVFEAEIADLGEKIIKYREKYIKNLENYLPDIYLGLSGKREKIMTVYVANCYDNIKEKLISSRNEDMYLGVTSVGPHRDDIKFLINGEDARSFGSQGQQRSVAIALKLASAEIQKEISGEKPICLLDDVMSELDNTRQRYILNHIENMQTFITCCDKNDVTDIKEGNLIEVKNGGIA